MREATQLAFEQLVLKVRRELAPFLKSLMGHWLLAQCDTYPPAASAACQAFHAAFPPSKQPEALSFCRDEVLNVSVGRDGGCGGKRRRRSGGGGDDLKVQQRIFLVYALLPVQIGRASCRERVSSPV